MKPQSPSSSTVVATRPGWSGVVNWQVLQKLESTGQSENTIVVLVSARGSTEAPDSKEALNEHAIKVPLLFRAPGIAAKDISSSVSTMDIAPTLYELANIQAPQRTQGRSLLSEEPRQWSLSRLRHPEHQHQTALCTERYKLVAHHAQTDSGETLSFSLYDLHQDPEEQNDMASSMEHQDQLEDMIDQLIDARVALEDRTEPRTAKF